MKVTEQQKILAAVLVLGAVALVLDRFVFPVAGAAPAAMTDAASEYAVTGASPMPQTPARTTPPSAQSADATIVAPTLAQRLNRAAAGLRDHVDRDAFALPGRWITQPAAAPTEHPADAFRQGHRLTGVLESGSHGYVMVDGQIVGLGQTIDGFRLISISHRRAIFEGNGEQVTLSMVERITSGSTDTLAGAQP
jgi:hypothetical protein